MRNVEESGVYGATQDLTFLAENPYLGTRVCWKTSFFSHPWNKLNGCSVTQPPVNISIKTDTTHGLTKGDHLDDGRDPEEMEVGSFSLYHVNGVVDHYLSTGRELLKFWAWGEGLCWTSPSLDVLPLDFPHLTFMMYYVYATRSSWTLRMVPPRADAFILLYYFDLVFTSFVISPSELNICAFRHVSYRPLNTC